MLRVLQDSEKHTHKQNWLAGSKRRTMDKEEAERLARAIRKAPVNWIQVSGVEQNPTTDTYEVKCEYKQARDATVTFQGVLDDAADKKPPPVDRFDFHNVVVAWSFPKHDENTCLGSSPTSLTTCFCSHKSEEETQDIESDEWCY
jgi:hypothetical protein